MKRVLRIVLWSGLAILLILGVVEGILWVTAPVPKAVGYTVELDNEIPGVKQKVAFEIDEQFLRKWRSSNKGARTIRIVCLGGSATAGMLQNDKETWWGQLGGLLEQHFPDTRFEVSALVREGTGILYAAKWAGHHLAATGCDILIAVYGLDDILLKPETYTYRSDQLESVKLGGHERGRVKQFLVDVSQICRRISHSRQRRSLAGNLGRWRERNFYAKALARERAIYAQLPIKYEFARPIGQDPAREYVDGLSSLAAMARANNAVFLAVGEPTLHSGVMGPAEERLVHRWFVADPKAGDKGVFRMDSGRIELELGRYFSAAQEACQPPRDAPAPGATSPLWGVPFMNTQRQFPPNAIIFVDDVQFTDDGAVGFARLLEPKVKTLVEGRLK